MVEKEEAVLLYDMEHLECRPWGGEAIDQVVTSLDLPDRGRMGSRICWISDTPDIVTPMGRVIRPDPGEPPREVSLTAQLSLGKAYGTKRFSLRVLPYPALTDPCYESDEAFFRKLDFRKPGLKAVKDAVYQKNYRDALELLLGYLRQKEIHGTNSVRMPAGLVQMHLAGVNTLQRSDRFFKGLCEVTSCDYTRLELPVLTEGLCPGMVITYDISVLYNSAVGVSFAGSSWQDTSMRPCLRLHTQRGTFAVSCADCAVVGAGRHAGQPLAMSNELYARLFGPYLGDNTFHSLLKFDLAQISSPICSAELILYAKKDRELDGGQTLLALLFPENTWKGETARWKDFKWQTANRNGLPQTDPYEPEEGFDFEYFFQRVRFRHFPWLLEEYRASKDERIPCYLLKTMLDFIRMQGMPRRYLPSQEHIGSAWRDETTSRTLCGGWPRGLDAAERIASFASVFHDLVNTKWMTPQACAAILKYVWDTCNGLAFLSLTKPVTNLRQFELVGLLTAARCFDDFTDQAAWLNQVQDTMEEMICSVTLEDGTYNECTGGYNDSVCRNFVEYWKQCRDAGIRLSHTFMKRLFLFARYNMLLQGPSGESFQYGDQSAAPAQEIHYPELAQICTDPELRFLLSRGQQGTEPAWTSFFFPAGSVALLRTGWEKDAVVLFTQARGGGHHGHQDDCHITLMAGKRVLLTDAGIFTYSQEDPFRQWGMSSQAHNTVSIDTLPQSYFKGAGECTECVLDPVCNIVTLRSARYEGYSFSRQIVFLKPSKILVTDEIIPQVAGQEILLRQCWHMRPEAEMTCDFENKCMSSHFVTGPNLCIRCLDADVSLIRETGWYDYGYQQLRENPFGYFTKKITVGRAVFHTLLEIQG